MSLNIHAFVEKDKVPSKEQWQIAIDMLGYDFELDPELIPNIDSGFVPCKLNGKKSGFEIYYENIDEYLDFYPQLKEKLGPRNWCITYRFGGDFAEYACVLISSMALIKSFNALVYDPNEDMFINLENALADLKACLDEM